MLLSIIVCTYSRAKDLAVSLDSLKKQEPVPGWDVQVLVVDNSPTGWLKDVVAVAQKEWPQGALSYHHEPKHGKSSALNTGIRLVKGDIIAFTDDDVVADPAWIAHMLACFKATGCDGVGGRVMPVFADDTPQWIKDHSVQLAGSVVIYDYGPETRPFVSGMYPFIGANYAFKKEVFKDCGLFREDMGPGMPVMGEDTEFIERLHKQGKKMFYCGQALIHHPFDPKRLGLNHVARWHISLGKFDAQREMQTGQAFVRIMGVPRYLFLGAAKDMLRLVPAAVSKHAFYNAWRSLFRKVGMIQAYRSAVQGRGATHA